MLIVLIMMAHLSSAQDLKLWYDEPGKEWVDGLPLGNGRLLAMVQGGFQRERIQLNEETLWTGQAISRDNPEAGKYIPQIRQLIFDGKYVEADKLARQKVLGTRLAFGQHTYQTLGDLDMVFEYPQINSPATEYYRELDLETAIVKVSYKVQGITFTREVFSSPVDQAIIVRLACDQAKRLNVDVQLSRTGAITESIAPNCVAMHGVAVPEGDFGFEGVHYESQLLVDSCNGEVSSIRNGFRIRKASEITLKIVAASNYRGGEPRQLCTEQLKKSEGKSYAELCEAHIKEHQRLFSAVTMSLGEDTYTHLPTDQRLEAFRNGTEDPQLIALYFQFGRYLLLSSSRPGCLPVNLWGKWTDSYNPRYNGDYHININFQLCYWMAEVSNLGECHKPFIDFVDLLRERGRVTAKTMYGARGFCAHHTTDAWLFTSSFGNTQFGLWPMAPAWLCQHLWEHYLFNGDMEYLRNKSYPIMKEAAEFFLDYLVEHPETGYMVSGPSASPENRFISPEGKPAALCMSPTMDIQLINDLFSNCISASKALDIDRAFRKELENLQQLLPPMQIGEDGRLLEWSMPFEENKIGHRHISHLWGLSPGNQITPSKTPELASAARKSLDVRVEHGAADCLEYQGIGAWIINCYTRLLDGDMAYDHIKSKIAKYTYDNLFTSSELGQQMLMFETDSNLGNCAGIAELFLQSHDDAIHLLPALPGELPNGQIKGFRARGAFEVDMEWKHGKLNAVTIKSINGEPCKLKYGNKEIEFETYEGEEYRFGSNLEN